MADVSWLLSVGSSCAAGTAELAQRVIIIVFDLVLICLALSAAWKDWYHSCDEPLSFYSMMCVVLCVLDVMFELIRCSLESQLDRLQADFRPELAAPAGQVNEGLLGDELHEGLGQPRVEGSESRNVRRVANIIEGTLGHGVRKEKALKQKRASDMHFWSIVFSCFVSIVFAFFSAHDEDCAEHVPKLYKYIHLFTYVFIFRLGLTILWGCCRTVKNYEDAATAAGALERQQGMPMRTF